MDGLMHGRAEAARELRRCRRRSRWLALFGAAGMFFVSSVAAAQDEGGPGAPAPARDAPVARPAAAPPAGGGAMRPPPSASELPPGPIKRLILDLKEALRQAREPEAIVEKPLREAIRAAERARGARAAGDTRHGGMLERLAEQWVKTGEAIVKAVGVEARAAQATAEVQELTTKLERAEALLVEQQARLGRLRSELEEAEAALADDKARAAAAEDARLDEAAGRKRKGGAKR